MRRWLLTAWAIALLALFLVATARGTATTDPVPATVAALETRVAGLATTVAAQSTQISALQTAVAQGATPAATPVETPDPQSLIITITFRADPEEIRADGLGSPCSGRGDFRDFSPQASIGVFSTDEVPLARGRLVDSALTHEGTIFSECMMVFRVEDIPYQESYLISITNRSVLEHTWKELFEMDWLITLHYS